MTHNIRAGIVIHRAGDVAVCQLVGKGISTKLQFALRHMRGLPLQLGMLRQQQLANLAGPAVTDRRIAGLIAEVDAGASLKQRLDIGFIIHFDRQHQRAEVVGGDLVHLCAALHQRRDHRRRPLTRRHLQRRESFTVRLIHLHTGGRQRQHQIGIIPAAASISAVTPWRVWRFGFA